MVEDLLGIKWLSKPGGGWFRTGLSLCLYGEFGRAIWSQALISTPCSVSTSAFMIVKPFDLRNEHVAAMTLDSVSMCGLGREEF